MATDGRGTTPPGGVIDITGVYPSPPMALSLLRGSVLFIAALVALGIWVFLWILPVAQEEMGPKLLIFLVIIFGPPIYGFYWLMSRTQRWNTGISTFLTADRFTPAERSRPIPSLDLTVGEVLARVERFAASLGKPMIVRETGTKALQARGLRAGGFALLLFAIYLGAQGGAQFIAALICLGAMPLAFARASKLLQPSVTTLLAADRRRPILLLRAFRDDDAKASQTFATPIGKILLARRFEQGIAGGLSTFGPLIAVGKPGEELPEIGAARSYLSDAEWQPAVLDWIRRSLFIIMVAGTTQWITWELQRIVEHGRHNNLFIMLPPGNNQARWQNVVNSLANTPWHHPLQALDFQGLILVRLLADGAVTAIRQRGRPVLQDYELALALAIHDEFCRDDGASKAT
jgi:hypothetical protein